MYLFTRMRRADPAHMRAAVPWAAEVATCVTSETGRPVEVWTAMMSPDSGQMVWTSWADHVVDIENALDKLRTSLAYTDLIERGQAFFNGHVADGLWTTVHGDPSKTSLEYVATVRATARNGRIGAAMTMGVELAKEAQRITGHETVFSSALTGTYGDVSWATGCNIIDEIERSNIALAADPRWMAAVDKAGDCFNTGAQQSIYRRIH
jgi:hypothetical protein